MDPTLYRDILTYKKDGTFPPSLSSSQKTNFRRKCRSFEVQDGELFYVRHKGTVQSIGAKVLCGAEEANEVFLDFHASGGGAHCGQKKTRESISNRFYWPGMSDDISLWVSQCVQCQASKAVIKQEVTHIPIKVTKPFELIGMDLVGKLKVTQQGNQYICVLIDYLTKWPQAYALKTKSASEVTECIIKFCYQFEAPKRILTDQGREFVNDINKNVCKLLNIKRSLCAPYHPQTNGLVERMNGTIQRALSKLVNKKPEEWDNHLDAVMFGLRTKVQVTTKFSPFFLMFGREARYPCQIPSEYKVDSSVEQNLSVEELTEDILKLDEVLQAAITNSTKSKEREKKRKKATTPNFHVGMKVWRLNVRSQQRKGGKLDPNYLGPYTITAITEKSVDLVDNQGVTLPKISTDHLSLFREEQPRVPRKCRAAAATSSTSTTAAATAATSMTSAPTTAATSMTSAPTTAATSMTSAPTTAATSMTSAPTTAATSMTSAPTTAATSMTSAPTTAATSMTSAPTTAATSMTSAPTTAATSMTSASTTAATSMTSASTTAATSMTSASTTAATSMTSASTTAATSMTSAPTTAATSMTSASTTAATSMTSAPTTAATSMTSASTTAATSMTSAPTTAATSMTSASTTAATSMTSASTTAATSMTSASTTAATSMTSASTTAAAATTASTSSSAITSTATSAAATSLSSIAVDPLIIRSVKDAWKGKKKYILLSKIGPYKIFHADIFNTAPQREIESEVINAYLTLLVKKFNEHNAEMAFCIDSFEMTNIWAKKKPKIKVDPGLYKYILGVVNENHHWMLVVILPGGRRSLFLDPLGETQVNLKRCQDITRSFMRHRGINVSRWVCDTLPHPRQEDATSCGAFVLKFAECIMDGCPITLDSSASGIKATRHHIAVYLLQNTDDLADLCYICGEQAGDTNWVGCDICPRWYHSTCAKKPPKTKKFICQACK